jgi:hypothetical protein
MSTCTPSAVTSRSPSPCVQGSAVNAKLETPFSVGILSPVLTHHPQLFLVSPGIYNCTVLSVM